MNLKSGTLLWHETLPTPPQYPVLEEDITCDVLVIGGGEAGTTCSYLLTENGVDTVLVERRHIGYGSTSANTGLLQFANDKTLTACIHSFGVEGGVRFYQLCKDAVDDLETITSKLDFSSDFIRRDSLYYASTPDDLASLRTEYDNLKTHGFPVTWMDANAIGKSFSFSRPGAIYSTGDAEINPYKLANALVSTASKKGLRVYQDTEVRHHIKEGDELVFHTSTGKQIRCKTAVFATGYETQEIHTNKNAVLTSSYAIATQPLADFPGWPNRCLIWETARPYLYLRTTADNRIVVGGLDEPSPLAEARDAKLVSKTQQLLDKVEQLFPGVGKLRADFAWSAAFGGTHDGLPMFGVQDEFPGCYFLLGYGGNGTVYSAIGGRIICDLIVKGKHPDADLFAFNRRKSPTFV
ncbi:NAD(P)/FAD-dependent oxidoreductase [Brevibacillus dissolubilis]|uniref:NAD(P)/FAD-dependent oxidoreductase n=1 Tax=Brevibacillus dissolubilis TaxID=1844116 RepID=UPI001117176B|nr:FAD-dependent oxidoreductase [Brevibacillus dissolubilis]